MLALITKKLFNLEWIELLIYTIPILNTVYTDLYIKQNKQTAQTLKSIKTLLPFILMTLLSSVISTCVCCWHSNASLICLDFFLKKILKVNQGEIKKSWLSCLIKSINKPIQINMGNQNYSTLKWRMILSITILDNLNGPLLVFQEWFLIMQY